MIGCRHLDLKAEHYRGWELAMRLFGASVAISQITFLQLIS